MFSIITDFSIYFLFLCIFIGFLYAYVLYRNEISYLRDRKFFLFLFRLLLVSILSFLLLNPLLIDTDIYEEEPLIVLAQDASVSTSEYLDSSLFSELDINLTNDFEVLSYNYSNIIENGFTNNKKGSRTNISKLFDDISLKYSSRNIAGILISSDGLYNEGSNPKYHSILQETPIYCISYGDTNKRRDIQINNVLYNEVSFLGNTTPIEVHFTAERCRGKSINIELYQNGNLIKKKSLKISNDSDFRKHIFEITNNQLGIQQFSVRITKIDGEINYSNNSEDFYLEIINSKYNVLILSHSPHPDISSIRSVLNKNDNINTELMNINDVKDYKKYNLVIVFFPDNINNLYSKYQELVNTDLPMMCFLTPQSIKFLDLSYPSADIKSTGQINEAFPDLNQEFSKFNIPINIQNYLKEIPPLYSLKADYKIPVSSEVLLYQKIGNYVSDMPIILFDNYMGRKISFIFGEGIWRWKINDNNTRSTIHENFDYLFSKIFQYLIIQEDKSRFRLNHKKKIEEGNIIEIFAEYYNESYELNNEKEVDIIFTDEDGNDYKYLFNKNSDNSYSLIINSLSSGLYSYVASYNDGSLQKKGRLTILERKIEDINQIANHQLLFQLSAVSGGKQFFDFNQDSIALHLKNSIRNKKIIHSIEKKTPIISNKSLLIFLLFLVSSEWLVRKFIGLD